ncbi:MAG TPA: zinc-binding dehydrogenase, partial [Vicinamibacteria bacterium]|nr:zinc-binding dehydrogenase [Vicinamibacteria bacterium]
GRIAVSARRRMKAAVLHGREDVRLEEVDVPQPGPGEILLRHRVALTCGTDVKVYRRGYHARMITPPAVFGHEVAGVVEEVGAGVAGWEPGTAVVPANSAPCGACDFCQRGRPSLCEDLLFWNGAYAEFGVIPARIVEKNLLRLPPGLPFRDAAMVEPLACVVRGVEESGIGPGLSVAVLGVGPIGQMFVALARRRGARVIALGRHAGRLARAQALGAVAAVKVEEGQDLVQALREASPQGQGPDVVVEAVGLPHTSEAAIGAVRKGGTVQLFGGCPAGTRVSFDAQRLHYDELTIRATFHHTPQSVREAFRLIAAGEIAPAAFVTGEEPLERLPQVLANMARGGEGLKTAIRPARDP